MKQTLTRAPTKSLAFVHAQAQATILQEVLQEPPLSYALSHNAPFSESPPGEVNITPSALSALNPDQYSSAPYRRKPDRPLAGNDPLQREIRNGPVPKSSSKGPVYGNPPSEPDTIRQKEISRFYYASIYFENGSVPDQSVCLEKLDNWFMR